MQAQRQQHEKANPRLAKAVGRGEGERGGAGGKGARGRGGGGGGGGVPGVCRWEFALLHMLLFASSWHRVSAHSPGALLVPSWCPTSSMHTSALNPPACPAPLPCLPCLPFLPCLPALPAEDPLAILRDEDEADSDEEWRGIKERAAARQVVKTTAPQVGVQGCPAV